MCLEKKRHNVKFYLYSKEKSGISLGKYCVIGCRKNYFI